MDANQQNCSAEDQSDNEDSETVTMLDVLQEEQDLEENAFAVLGGSDDQNCTYVKVCLADDNLELHLKMECLSTV